MVSVSAVQAGDSVNYYLRANKAGKATITVASALDPSRPHPMRSRSRLVSIPSALMAALSKATSYSESVYTKDSYAALTAAVGGRLRSFSTAARAAIAEGCRRRYDQDRKKAIDGLKMRPVDEKKLINTPENRENVKVTGFLERGPTMRAATPSTLLTAMSRQLGTATMLIRPVCPST